MMDKKELRLYVGRKVAEGRTLAGLTQDDLAQRLGVSKSAVGMMEIGSNGVTIDRLYDLAVALDREVAWFLPGGAAPDVAAGLLAAFPGMTENEVRGVLDFARYLRSPQSRVRVRDDGSVR